MCSVNIYCSEGDYAISTALSRTFNFTTILTTWIQCSQIVLPVYFL